MLFTEGNRVTLKINLPLGLDVRGAHRWAQEMCRLHRCDGYIFQGVSYTSSGQTKGGE